MKFPALASAAALAVLLFAGFAYAGEGNTQTPASTDTPAAAMHPDRHECERQADAQNLHNKARRKFITKCMKGA